LKKWRAEGEERHKGSLTPHTQKTGLSHILGDFFHKLIWSPCRLSSREKSKEDIKTNFRPKQGDQMSFEKYRPNCSTTDIFAKI
jgi:hypothetical protein